MTDTIKQKIWKIIQSDLSIQKDLDRGIINTRALARHIINKYGLEASLDSAISSIRRFETKQTSGDEEKKLSRVFKDSKISTRNNIACFTLERKAIGLMNKISSKNIRLVIGTDQIKLACSKEDTEYFYSLFSGFVEKVEKDLGELSLVLSPEAIKTKGVMARIANEIAMRDINIIELLVSPPEFLIYVKQKDVIKTHESLLELSG